MQKGGPSLARRCAVTVQSDTLAAVRLGLIVPGGFDRGDRVITALLNLTTELACRHDVHVFAADGPSGPGRYWRGGATVHQLAASSNLTARLGPGRRALRRGRFVSRLIGEVNRVQSTRPFDLLHAFWALDTGLTATLIGRRLGLPVVVTVGGGEAVWLPAIRYGGGGSIIGRLRTRAALRLASAITAGSVFAAQHLPGSASARTRIIPLGIRCETFDVVPDRPPGPPWRLLQVADLNLVKDQETLLQAFRQIVVRLGDVSLDCVGEDTLRGHLRRKADALGLSERVRFHGFLPQRMLPDLYRRAHLHVVSSLYESQGVAILEAAAAGLPTVGTAVGLIPTMAPGAARCVATGDANGLAQAVCEALVDGTARESMGAAAKRWALDHDAGWTAREFERVYASLVS
jgi:glycosyltransferase involved in cell wall biosynthesis